MEESNTTPAAYSFGKIHNKHLILEIFGFAGNQKQISNLLFGTNKNLRRLVLKNYKVFQKLAKKCIKPITNDFDHTAQQHYGVNFKLMKQLKESLNKNGFKFKTFKFECRSWITSFIQRQDFFAQVAEKVKPPFVLLSYSSDRWDQSVKTNIHSKKWYEQAPSAELLLFHSNCFPLPPQGKSKVQALIKIDRKLSIIYGQSYKTYDARLTRDLNIELIEEQEPAGKDVVQKMQVFNDKKVYTTEIVGLNGEGTWWVVDIYTLK